MRALMACTVAGLVLACNAAAAPPILRHGELVARADRICERYADRLQGPTGRQGTLGEPEYDAAWLRLFGQQRRDLAALRPGRHDATAYRRFLESLPVLEEAARTLMAALETKRGDRKAHSLLRGFLDAHRDSARRARAIGMRRCPAA